MRDTISKLKRYMLNSRITATRLMVVLPGILLLITENRWPRDSYIDLAFEMIGLCLVAVGAFGRLWALMYVSGYKRSTLVTEGPYSVVRNPLYVFSLIGATGVAFSSESLIIVSMVVAAFVLSYPSIIEREEKELALNHGAEFTSYAARTPRFIPRWSLFHEPVTYVVNAKQYRKAYFDAMFFILIYGLIQVIVRLHELKVLPAYFKIL